MRARWGPRRSARRSRPQIVKRQLCGRIATTLRAVFDVPPRAQEPRSFGVEQHHKGLGIGVELKSKIRPPAGRGIFRVEVQPLEDPAKPHAMRVEDPRAVAGLEDERNIRSGFHNRIMPEEHDESAAGALRSGCGLVSS
jgi:hypothetical protein